LRARNRLVEDYLPLVRSLAARYRGRAEPYDDLVQVAAIGLIKAIDRYDPERGAELTSYAIPTIIGELRRHFRDRAWSLHVPRRLKELSLRLTFLVEDLTTELGRSPTVAELASSLDASEEEIVEALDVGRAYATVAFPTARDEDSDGDAAAPLGVEEAGYETGEDRALLASSYEALDPRERRILHLRFFAGLSQSEIAREVGVSQMHVSRLIRRALDKLRDALESGGPGEELR
jgi:RNA polymerase sigma-B factor